MSWFQLDANSVADRVRASGQPPELSCAGTFLRRGIVGLTLLSIAGFAPWAFLGRWFYARIGEGGLYAVCALVYIGLSGPLLHKLIIGPGSLPRFYKLFAIIFAANSVLWTAGWMALRGQHEHLRSLAGLLAGTAAMGWLLARAFGAKGTTLKVIAVLFLFNTVGYFVGGWLYAAVTDMKDLSLFGTAVPRRTQGTIGRLLWGVCYGAGLGAGLGLAFHLCQAQTRATLRESKAVPPEVSIP